MTTRPNTRRDDRNARQTRPDYFRDSVKMGHGVTARLVINGALASSGDMILEVTTLCLGPIAEQFLAQPGTVFDYSEPVSRTATVQVEDSKVSVTLIFEPPTKPSLSLKATGRAETAHYLQHLVTMATVGITTHPCAEASVNNLTRVFELDLSGMPGSPLGGLGGTRYGSLSDLLNGGRYRQ